MKYRAEVDGLRAVAVVPVILFHAGFAPFSGGFVGVDVFFVISGYLITSIILAEKSDGRFSIARFYERRMRRILPALYVVMACCVVFAWAWMLPRQMRDFGRSVAAVTGFASNVLFWQETGYFEPDVGLKPLLHTWSLAVEEQYYLLFPLAMGLLWRLRSVWMTRVLAGIAIASLALCEYASRVADPANFYLAPTRAWELLTGALCALVLLRRPPKPHELLSFAGIGAVVCSTLVFSSETRFPSLYAGVPVAGTALILLFCSRDTLVGKVLTSRGFVGIGLISYSAYLWHQPLFAFARLRHPQEPSLWLMLFLSAASLALGYLSWRFVETPFRRKNRPLLSVRKHLFLTAAVTAALFLGIGGAAAALEGFPSRWSQQTRDAIAHIDAVAKERVQSIRTRKCHFNARGDDVDTFLNQWDCRGLGEAGLRDARVAIFGDSLAADRAWAMRAAGENVVQMTAASCSLSPSVMVNHCKTVAQRFVATVAQLGHVERVWLVNKYAPQAVRVTEFEETLEFWSQLKVPTTIFSPVVSFPNLEKVYYWGRAPEQLMVDAEVFTEFKRNHLAAAAQRRGFSVIDNRRLLCAAFPNCSPFLNGRPLLKDPVHLTPEGAKLLGARLVGIANGQGEAFLWTDR